MGEKIGADSDIGTGVQLRHQGLDIAAGAKGCFRICVQYDADDISALAPFQQLLLQGLKHLQGHGVERLRVV